MVSLQYFDNEIYLYVLKYECKHLIDMFMKDCHSHDDF